MTLQDADLQIAHAKDDKPALVALYERAAHQETDPNARAFFLTHAYIFALEIAHPNAANLKAELAELGRETP